MIEGRVVVVGASLAGLRAAESLRRAGHTGPLTIVGAEPHSAYDRPPLSKAFLQGAVENTGLLLRQTPTLGADWLLSQRAVGLDCKRRTVTLDSGDAITYDGLVIATGAEARHLPAVPTSTPGVHALRTLDDATALRHELTTARRVVIIGGGFIGSEVASTCRDLGIEVTVISPIPLLANALGPLGEAATIRAQRHGVQILTQGVVGITGTHRVAGVCLDDGSVVQADVVIVAIGAQPCTAWLQGSGLTCTDGVECDETMAVVGAADVVAAGDVASWPHPALGGAMVRLEHWANASEQASWASRRLLAATGPAYAPVPSFWSDQFGIRLQGIGFPMASDQAVIVEGDPAGDHFLAEYRRSGQLVGAVGACPPQSLLPYRQELMTSLLQPVSR